jgi:hypothetical protein
MSDEVSVVEGVEGPWNYPLRKAGELRSLCGKTVMATGVPLAAGDWDTLQVLDKA